MVVCESETVGNTGYHHLFAICEPNCPVLVVACHLTTVQHFQNFMQIYRYTSESAISTSGFRAPSGLSGIISGMRRSAFGLPHPLFSRYDDCNCVLLFVNKDPTDSRWDYCNFLSLIAICPTNPAYHRCTVVRRCVVKLVQQSGGARTALRSIVGVC